MKQHIDTAPVWESYRQDCECPMCLLYNKAETANVGYFLGESVMEQSQRIEVNQKGFCAAHFKRMYDVGNRLGLALMTHTYMKQTTKRLGDIAAQVKQAASDEAGKPIFPAQGRKIRQAARQHFVYIALVPHVENDPVLHGVIDVMQRYRQLHDPQIGRQVPAGEGNIPDQFLTQLPAQLFQLGEAALTDIRCAAYMFKQTHWIILCIFIYSSVS